MKKKEQAPIEKLIEEAHQEMCDANRPNLLYDYLHTSELDGYINAAHTLGKQEGMEEVKEILNKLKFEVWRKFDKEMIEKAELYQMMYEEMIKPAILEALSPNKDK
jgi:hypothetical protein